MKIGKFSPAIFSKNSVKSTFSVKSYTKVDEKILQWGKISEITTLHCALYSKFLIFHTLLLHKNLLTLSLTMKIFREINTPLLMCVCKG